MDQSEKSFLFFLVLKKNYAVNGNVCSCQFVVIPISFKLLICSFSHFRLLNLSIGILFLRQFHIFHTILRFFFFDRFLFIRQMLITTMEHCFTENSFSNSETFSFFCFFKKQWLFTFK